MVKNEKGFTLVEVMGMLAIITILITPLMTTLVNNISQNKRMHLRQAALAVAENTLNSVGRLDYINLATIVDDAPSEVDGYYHIELNEDTCISLGDENSSDVNFCDIIFTQIFGNNSYDATSFKMYIYPYYLTTTMKNELIDVDSSGLPTNVIAYIETLSVYDPLPAENLQADLLNVSVWIQYDDDPVGTVSLNGLITYDEWEIN